MNLKLRNLLIALAPSLLALAGVMILLGVWSGPLAAQAEALAVTRYVSSVSGTDAGNACAAPSSPCQTVQHAVNQAEDGDEIWIAAYDNWAAARYTGAGANVIVLTKSVTLRGGYLYAHVFPLPPAWTLSPVPAPSPVDGEGARRALAIIGPATPTVELLALVNGSAEQGGNIYAENAALSFIATSVTTGTATRGGGLYLKNCRAFFDLGAIISGALPSLNGLMLIQHNTAQYGGGLYIEGGSPILGGLIVYSNTAAAGGGLYLKDSAARLAASAIYSNSAASGAGIYLDGPFTLNPLDVPILANNYIRYNRAGGGKGGGVYLRLAMAGLVNNVMADNTAADGAGLYLWASSPLLLYNTVAQNTGSSSVYLTHQPGSFWPPILPIPSLPSFTNTIVASSTTGIYVASTGLPYPFQNRATMAGTLWWANGNDTGGPGQVVTSADVWGDPRFTCTGNIPACLSPFHVMTDSAAVDAGVQASVVISGVELFVDIDGQLRPSGAGYDIGVDEVMQDNGVGLVPSLSALTAEPGKTVTHTHRLLNTGAQTDTFDLSLSSSTGWAALVTASPITLAAQSSATVQVRVTAPSTATGGSSDNTLLVAVSRASNQSAYALDLTMVAAVSGADLSLSKRADRPGAPPGGAVRFTLVVTKAGPLTSTLAVTLTDTAVPTQAIAGLGAPPGCQVDAGAGRVTCVFDLPAGAPPVTDALEIVVTTSSAYTGLLVNTAAVSAGAFDPNPLNNTAQAVVNIQDTQLGMAVTRHVTSVYAIAVRPVAITNWGNATVVDLACAPSLWPAHLSTETIALGAGMSATVFLTVEFPYAAAEYATDLMTLTIAPQSGDPSDIALVTSTGCRFDFVEDAIIDISDLVIEVAAFGGANPYYDMDHNGIVEINDILLVIGRFGQVCSPP